MSFKRVVILTILILLIALPQMVESRPATKTGPRFGAANAGLETLIFASDDLQKAIDSAADGTTIEIYNRTCTATSSEFVEHLCGNCENPVTEVNASYGFHIKGKSLTLQGKGMDGTTLVTNAGYGILIEDCPSVKIFDLAITGGERDQDGSATCAAIVVRNSNVEVAYCRIFDNQGDYEKPVAGIGGIFGREGAILNIHHNIIHDNSWDGVALYRGAVAQIYDNEIYNGRGAAVGITWDARAEVIRNNIHGYWKGIGSFGESRVGAYHNFVHDLGGWEIIATGTSDMICRNNTVVRCGNVGIAGWSDEARMEIVNNIIANNGMDEKWVAPRGGIWMNCLEGNYRIAHNIFWENYHYDVAFGFIETDDDWTYAEERDFIGVDGNLFADPMLIAHDPVLVNCDPVVHITSPCIDNGDPQYVDLDGTPSDIGASI